MRAAHNTRVNHAFPNAAWDPYETRPRTRCGERLRDDETMTGLVVVTCLRCLGAHVRPVRL